MRHFASQSGSIFRSVAVLGLGTTLVLTGCSSPGDEEVTPSPSPVVEATTQTPEPSPETDVTESEEPEPGFAGAVDPLEAYIDEELAYVADNLERFEEVYSDVTIEAEPPNGVVYTYTYAEQLDPDEAIARLEETGWHGLNSTVRSTVFPIMEQKGIEAPAVTYVYLNADGSGLMSYNFVS